jgi:putative endonuclease
MAGELQTQADHESQTTEASPGASRSEAGDASSAKGLLSMTVESVTSAMDRGGCVYILTNAHHTVFYAGVTSDLKARIVEHREKHFPRSFTSRYNVTKLVYFETFSSIEEAIAAEKYIKGKVRAHKIRLIEKYNPEWKDLAEEVMEW